MKSTTVLWGFRPHLFGSCSVIVRKTPPFSEDGSNKSQTKPEQNPPKMQECRHLYANGFKSNQKASNAVKKCVMCLRK